MILGDVLARALAAYEALTALGEEVEDEWSYVNDLSSAWRTHLETVADARGEDLATEPVAAAIDRAIDEIGRITDPHRAIDWLSTFPQVLLVALEEGP